MRDLGVRLLSGIIGLVLLVGILLMGDYYLALGLLLLSIIALREFYNAVRNLESKPVAIIGYMATILIYCSFYVENLSVNFILSISAIILLIFTVTLNESNVIDTSLTIMGVIYIPLMLFYILLLDGSDFIWVVFLVAFGTDTFAYLTGNWFGKRKLCPDISPKKSVEGALGGIIGSVVVTILFSVLAGIEPLWSMGILALLGSVMSQLGDLVASRIKRLAGIKDYGKVMPGHGGMLDRFDSIIFTAPLVYYYAYYFLM